MSREATSRSGWTLTAFLPSSSGETSAIAAQRKIQVVRDAQRHSNLQIWSSSATLSLLIHALCPSRCPCRRERSKQAHSSYRTRHRPAKSNLFTTLCVLGKILNQSYRQSKVSRSEPFTKSNVLSTPETHRRCPKEGPEELSTAPQKNHPRKQSSNQSIAISYR